MCSQYCMDGQCMITHRLTKADQDVLLGSIGEVAARLAWTPIYFDRTRVATETTDDDSDQRVQRHHSQGWSLTLLQYINESLLAQNGLIGPRSGIALLQNALASVLNPLEAIEFPRLRHYFNIVFYLLFTVCFITLQRYEGDLLTISANSRCEWCGDERAEKQSMMLGFRIYVVAQCVGMVVTAARTASRYTIHFVLGDAPTILDCCIALLILLGEALIWFGAGVASCQDGGFIVLCCTNLVLGVRYLGATDKTATFVYLSIFLSQKSLLWQCISQKLRYIDFLRSIEKLAPLVRIIHLGDDWIRPC